MKADGHNYTDQKAKGAPKESRDQFETGDLDRKYNGRRCDKHPEDCSHGVRQNFRLVDAIGLEKSCSGINTGVDFHSRHNWSSTGNSCQLVVHRCY